MMVEKGSDLNFIHTLFLKRGFLRLKDHFPTGDRIPFEKVSFIK